MVVHGGVWRKSLAKTIWVVSKAADMPVAFWLVRVVTQGEGWRSTMASIATHNRDR